MNTAFDTFMGLNERSKWLFLWEQLGIDNGDDDAKITESLNEFVNVNHNTRSAGPKRKEKTDERDTVPS